MKILILEDEAPASRRLERMLKEILGVEADVSVAEGLQTGMGILEKQGPDLLFLDLNLSGEDGFDVLKNAAASPFQTIIVSANTDRAIKAFDYGVVDFVPKPFDLERLRLAIERFKLKTKAPESAKYLSIRKYGKLELIPLEDVCYFQGAGDYVEVHLRSGRMELHNKTLENLAQVLPSHFERIHKSFIVDMREMRQIHLEGGGKYHMELKNGKQLPISRKKYKEMKEGQVGLSVGLLESSVKSQNLENEDGED